MSDTRLILHIKGTQAETKEMPKSAVKEAVAQGTLSYSQLIWSAADSAWKQVRELPELLPGESMILHVKGTESETRQLPKQAVREGVSKGEISQSQLIWSQADNVWKQVREWPDLLPGEMMILHVKGTESQTKELPKQAVRDAVSKGELTRSQLIWSTKESLWKQVRELPELLPGETMILHVKGTEAETTELPKQAIRAAIQKGDITQSQLIWSPVDNTWKPVKEMPELQPGDSLILHVKGTAAETKEMPKQAIRSAIKKGQMTHSQLIWSAPENKWKQVRELPELLPSQKLAPAPKRAVPVIDDPIPDTPRGPVARAAAAAGVATGAVPKARPAVVAPPKVTINASAQPRVAVAATPNATPVATPQVRVAVAAASTEATPQVRATVAPGQAKPVVARAANPALQPDHVSHVVEEAPDHFNPLKWLCIGLGGFLLVLLGANYFLVDQRLASEFNHTNYSTIPIYAHFGAFIQPNVMVIHIPATTKITEDNIADVMAAIAKSTPDNLLTNDLFQRVALTSDWTAQYSFSGYSWKQFADEPAATRKETLLAGMTDASGDPLISPSTLDENIQARQREKVWQDFVSHFAAKP